MWTPNQFSKNWNEQTNFDQNLFLIMIKNVFIQDDHFDKKIFFNMIKKYFDQDQKNNSDEIFLIIIKNICLTKIFV